MKYLLPSLLLLISSSLLAEETNALPVSITTATDLSSDGKKALEENRAILLLISQDHCSYCMQIKREVIAPMILSGDYKDTLLIREIAIDRAETLIDFKGVEKDNSKFAYEYNVAVTPTLLFLSGEGKEVIEQMVGMQTPDMYYFYVDQSVQAAIRAVNQSGQ
ncbi:thioredoxin family protein [Sedimenticola thiotaurini]|uniref:thioredoxin family protein n=1 Tax=Sedimenticola thiotaurini TaxID=1543721 RepID=UPI00069C48C6|nr:thioredoxin fold domain-containing protein [Sedimenticola thiotaurini]